MDRLAQLMVRRAAHGTRARSGGAIAAALFAITAAAILTASVHWLTRADIRMTSNRESSVRALAVAEAGLAHALALVKDSLGDTTMTRLLRGWDGAKNTADDGLFVGYNLPTATQIPAAGRATAGGTYYVTLTDDPAEVDNDPKTDRNTRVLATCRGETSDGASAEVNAIVGNASMSGVSINGNFTISGTTQITGRCGGVHTNGNLSLGTTLTVETGASATGTVSGTVKNTYGETLPKEQGAPTVEFPNIAAADYCSRADYRISSTGVVTNLLSGTTVTLASVGWSGSGGMFEPSTSVTPGTYCVNGDVKMSSDIGTAANPKPLSLILVGGSMEISGNPYIKADDPEGILFIMDGDLKLNGNSLLGVQSFSGFIYAGAQCEMSGTVTIGGQVICHNKANPAGAEDWVSENKISGTTQIEYDCRGFLSQLWRVIAWYPTVGS